MRPLGPGWCRKALATVGVAVALTVGAAAQEAPDALLTTPITPQILATGNELDAYTLGVQAYVWGYPLVRRSGSRGSTPLFRRTTRTRATVRLLIGSVGRGGC